MRDQWYSISIHAPRGGSDDTPLTTGFLTSSNISIHAPRGGSDSELVNVKARRNNFNPRSPWGERPALLLNLIFSERFQSTLPVGGATRRACRYLSGGHYFNPRSPWGERLAVPVTKKIVKIISIHAPRGGSDGSGGTCFGLCCKFQSTLPVGGATYCTVWVNADL